MTKHTLLEKLLFHPRVGVLVNLSSDLGWRASLSTGSGPPKSLMKISTSLRWEVRE